MKKMIDYQVAGRPSQGYLSQPEQQGDTPGILVLHAWWGLTDFFRSVCDHLAKEGYTAFAPDLYGGQTADTVPDAQRLAETLDFQETRERVLMGLQVLKDYSGKEARIGALGFSLGAAWALYLSCLQPDDLQAVVVFYGSEAIDFSQAKCAYQGHFSDNDEWEPIEGVRKMETVLKEAGRKVSINIYPGVKHWFFEQDRPEYDPDASTVAWERTVEFLNQHLGKNTSGSGETSNERVRQKTGKGWQEWFEILDRAGAQRMSHPEIARFLAKEYQVSPWWCQQITGTYERARDMRVRHQMPEGFQIGKSKTYPISIQRIFRAWEDEEERARWLGEAEVTVRKVNPEKSIRIGWEGGKSSVEVSFYPKGAAKSQVTVQHSKLDNAVDAETMKAYWGAALARLQEYLQAAE